MPQRTARRPSCPALRATSLSVHPSAHHTPTAPATGTARRRASLQIKGSSAAYPILSASIRHWVASFAAAKTHQNADLPPVRIALEAGTHSIWISDKLQELLANKPGLAKLLKTGLWESLAARKREMLGLAENPVFRRFNDLEACPMLHWRAMTPFFARGRCLPRRVRCVLCLLGH